LSPEKNIIGQKPQKKKTSKGKLKKSKANIRFLVLKVVLIFFITFIFALISFSGAVNAYQNNSTNKALYGTILFGVDVGGLDRQEISNYVKNSLQDSKITFHIDERKIQISPQEIGISFLEEKIVDNTLKARKEGDYLNNFLHHSASLMRRLSLFFGANSVNLFTDFSKNVEISYQADERKLTKFIENLASDYEVSEKNAGLVMRGTNVQVIPAVYGKELVTETIRSQILEALKIGQAQDITISSEEVNPEILEKDTQQAIRKAQKIITYSVVYTYQGKTYSPGAEVIGSWIDFIEDDGKLVPIVSPGKVSEYINSIAKEINIAAISEKIKIVNGKEREVTREGENGLAVNAKLLAEKTAKNLNSGKGYRSEIPTYVVKYKTEVNNVLVANWDKYIEVDISSQRMCAYLAGGEKVNCWAVTTGANGWNTPTGTFLIRRKAGAGGRPGAYGGGVCMPNPPSTTPLCGINYVSTFTAQGHAIHEAWWRSSFGGSDYVWNGSHGCVNATYDIAKFIYYWAPIGTPVVIHY